MSRRFPLTGVVPVVALMVAACGSTQTSTPSTVTVTVSGAPPTGQTTVLAPPIQTPPPPAEMGESVIDDGFSVRVCIVGTSETKLDDSGGEIRDIPAHMVQIIVLSVSNVGAAEQTFYMADQRLRDDEGREFSPYVRPSDVSNNQVSLNPGLSRDVFDLQFEVPSGTSVDQYVLEVHGSRDSVGAAVRLRDTRVGGEKC